MLGKLKFTIQDALSYKRVKHEGTQGWCFITGFLCAKQMRV